MKSTSNTKVRGVPWTLLNFGNDIALCIPAFSREAPADASIVINTHSPKVSQGKASKLILTVKNSVGKKRVIALDEISLNSEKLVGECNLGSVIIVEEDLESEDNRRFVYLAAVHMAAISSVKNKGSL